MTVKTQRIYSGRTTRRLTIPLAYQPMARAIAGGVVVAIVCLAFLLDALERRTAAAEAGPIKERIVFVQIIATPTPALATPAVAAAPTSAPAPTLAPTDEPLVAAPAVEAQSLEVLAAPSAAGVDHERPHEEAPPAAWHPPLALPACGDWHPPAPYPAGCP